MFHAVHCIISETLAIFYSFFVGNLINYLLDPKAPQSQGLIYVAIFFTSQFLCQILRNRFIDQGFIMSVKLRRILVGALYDKTTKLSVKGMTETNSGKLISLINGDLF